jgi:LmbE family N-acetylglucosaminyl deacetylase
MEWVSRREFIRVTAISLLAERLSAQEKQIKVLAIVAHPDDEYEFAATIYRIARELGGVVDQVVISNGEAGFHYSSLAEKVYGLPLTNESVGRAYLPEIRKEETLAAGRILGIRQHHFLDQKDTSYTLDENSVDSVWDKTYIRAFVSRLLTSEGYDFVFTLLPASDTHGHHKAATLLALEAVRDLPEPRRPAVLGAEAASSHDPARKFTELAGYPLTRTALDVHEFNRAHSFGYHNGLTYQIIANWVIAEHKSQGLFQMDASRHDVERFWRFELSGSQAKAAADGLFVRVNTIGKTP